MAYSHAHMPTERNLTHGGKCDVTHINNQLIKVRLRYINVPMDAHGQLPVGSARASHFVDAETCEFPSLSMVPSSHFYELIF